MQTQSAQIQTIEARTSSDTQAQIAVVVSFIATLTLNTLAITLPLFGRSTKDISDSYPSFFTPAGLTFSIWSVLYLSQLAFTVFQAHRGGQFVQRSLDRRLARLGRLGEHDPDDRSAAEPDRRLQPP
jgi:hypothetical protein